MLKFFKAVYHHLQVSQCAKVGERINVLRLEKQYALVGEKMCFDGRDKCT